MSFLGMDTEQTRAYADTCARHAQALEDLQGRLDAVINGVAWMGPDRDAFTNEWHHHARNQLTSAHELLNDRAQQLLIEAAQQDHASAPYTDPTAGLFGPRGTANASDVDFGDLGSFEDFIAGLPLTNHISGLIGQLEDPTGLIDPSMLTNGIVRDWVHEHAPALGIAIDVLFPEFWLPFEALEIGVSGLLELGKLALIKIAVWLTADQPDVPWAEIAAKDIINESPYADQFSKNAEVTSNRVFEVDGSKAPKNMADLILHNDETRKTMKSIERIPNYNAEKEGQVRVQKIIGTDGVERYLVHVPPTQGEPLMPKNKFTAFGYEFEVPDPLNIVNRWDDQGQPFGWDNNIYAMAGMENPGANAVKLAMEEAGVPPGSEVALVGHSQGGLVAAQLAGDPTFNGGAYQVTDVFSVGSPVETYTPASATTDVTNIKHVDGKGAVADPVPNLDLDGRTHNNPHGNPAPNVSDVEFTTPEVADGYARKSDLNEAHNSVIWDNEDERNHFDPNSGYYGTVANNSNHPDIAAKDDRMRGKYYGDGVTLEEDKVVSVSRVPD